MGLLDNLMGGNKQGMGQMNDFMQRYMQGRPADGLNEDETHQNYQMATQDISDEDYELSAEEAFQRMDPQERMEFARMLGQQARDRNMGFRDLNNDGIDDRYQDPRVLARTVASMRRQEPGILSGMLGGRSAQPSGGLMQSPVAKAALAGIAVFAAKRMFNRGGMKRGA